MTPFLLHISVTFRRFVSESEARMKIDRLIVIQSDGKLQCEVVVSAKAPSRFEPLPISMALITHTERRPRGIFRPENPNTVFFCVLLAKRDSLPHLLGVRNGISVAMFSHIHLLSVFRLFVRRKIASLRKMLLLITTVGGGGGAFGVGCVLCAPQKSPHASEIQINSLEWVSDCGQNASSFFSYDFDAGCLCCDYYSNVPIITRVSSHSHTLTLTSSTLWNFTHSFNRCRAVVCCFSAPFMKISSVRETRKIEVSMMMMYSKKREETSAPALHIEQTHVMSCGWFGWRWHVAIRDWFVEFVKTGQEEVSVFNSPHHESKSERSHEWRGEAFFFIYLKILRKKTKILVASKRCKTNYRLENLMVNKSISNSKRKQNRHNDKNPKCFHTLYSGLSKCFTFEVSSQLNSEKDGSYLGGHFWGGKLQDKCLTNWSGTDCSRCWNVTRGILLRFCRSDDFVFNLK